MTRGRRAFTLVECMVAMYLFMLCVVYVYDVFSSCGGRAARASISRSRAMFLAQAKMEEVLLFGRPKEEAALRGRFAEADDSFYYTVHVSPWSHNRALEIVEVDVGMDPTFAGPPLVHLAGMRDTSAAGGAPSP